MFPLRLAGMAFVMLIGTLAGCERSGSGPADVRLLTQSELQAELDALQSNNQSVPGFSIVARLPDGSSVAAASGEADPDGRAMTPDTPVRQASITKTFVAAAMLRLWEQERVDLDEPIGDLISTEMNDLLVADGYDTSAITVRHILMHAGGLADHFGSDVFEELVFSNPDRVWTARDQIEMMVEVTDPLGLPGEAFAYSDSGYVLLGEILQTVSGQPLNEAVWDLLKLEELGLKSAWWDAAGSAPAGSPKRAHQWIGEMDTTHIHGSADAHGGGGIVSSMDDVALFFDALFDGEVFDNPATLELMTTAPGHPEGSPYRIGLFATSTDAGPVFGHSGFWGTEVFVLTDHDIVVAGVTLNQDGMGALRALRQKLISDHLTK